MRALARFTPLLLSLLAACATTASEPPSEGKQVEDLVQVEIAGNKAFRTKELRKVALAEMFLFRVERPSKASVDDAAYALRLFYLNRGYRSAKVDFVVAPDQTALSLRKQLPPLAVKFVIQEGDLTRLHSVEFLGNPSLNTQDLASFFGVDEKHTPFVQSAVEEGLVRLRAYYLELGFRDVKLALDGVVFDEAEKRAYVQIQVDEGLRYRLATVSFGGAGEELASAALQPGELIGQPYTPRLGFRLRSRILDALANRGYPRAEVSWKPELNRETGAVKLHFEIDPGDQVRLGAVVLSGNRSTRESAIRSRLPLAEGELYNASKIQEGLRELYSTGLFDSVRIDLDEANALQVKLLESSSLELRVEPGWGAYEGPRLNLVLEERNFLGTARRASLSTHLSPLASGARFSFFEPRIFGGKTDASASLFVEQREEPSFSFAKEGFDLVLRQQLSPHLVGSLGYEFRFNQLNDVDVTVLSLEDLEDPNVGQLAGGLSYDDRDDLLLPTRGTRASIQLELADQALGSEIDFLRVSLGWSRVFPLGEQNGVAFNARSVLTHALGGLDVLPLQERTFLGGENSVRSFQEDELGPSDGGGQPLGGEASNLLSVEWRRRLAGNFGSALFFDAGNVQENVGDYLEFDNLRFGVGVGLRYALPIGPLRLDLGFNPAARELEEDFVLHFSVGYSY